MPFLAAAGKHVRKSDKSFNSEIGVPLTILGVGNAWHDPLGWLSNIMRGLELIFMKADYPSILVLEVGADHPGDIEQLIKWLHPDVAVMTKIGDVPVHVEFFGSPEAVRKEKLFLAKGVKAGGTVILYADDEKMKGEKFDGRKVMSYGINEKSLVKGSLPVITYKDREIKMLDVRGLKLEKMEIENPTSNIQHLASYHTDGSSQELYSKKPTGISFKLEYAGNTVPVTLTGVLGIQHVYPILAAVAVGLDRGLPLAQIIQGLPLDFKPPRGRMNIIDGVNDSTIIDDTYNSSPTALASALLTLGEVHGASRKIAVLGDMMELGSYSADEHHKAGAAVAKILDSSRGDILATVGQRAKGMREGALAAGMSEASIVSFDDSMQAADKLKDMVQVGDLILVKGSQSPRMERIVKSLMADPSRAPDLLVRQEREWLDKR